MDRNSEPPDPTGLAFTWMARILAVAVVMTAPGFAGQWLDRRLGTAFISLLGFGVGLVAGFLYLLAMTGAFTKPVGKSGDDQDSEP